MLCRNFKFLARAIGVRRSVRPQAQLLPRVKQMRGTIILSALIPVARWRWAGKAKVDFRSATLNLSPSPRSIYHWQDQLLQKPSWRPSVHFGLLMRNLQVRLCRSTRVFRKLITEPPERMRMRCACMIQHCIMGTTRLDRPFPWVSMIWFFFFFATKQAIMKMANLQEIPSCGKQGSSQI